jgi:hypothetical protein
MQQNVRHTFTWLKVMAVAFVAELLFFFTYLHGDVSYWLNEFAYLLVFAVALIGVFVGLLLNLVTKFRRPVLTYAIGHVLLVVCIVLSESGKPESFTTEVKDNIEASAIDTTVTGITGDSKQVIEQVIYEMEQLYPFGEYDIISIDDRYVNDDSSGSSGISCDIIFSLKEEDNKTYISRYLMKDNVLQPVYVKKDTNSSEYREYIQNSKPL